MSFLWQFHDIFFKNVYAFQTSVERPVIIDCGANIGLSILYFKKMFPEAEVIGFEPDPDVYRALQQNVSGFSGVHCHEKAVWVHDRGIYLERDFADGAHVTEKSEHFISSIRLRDELGKHERIDLLKMDIEGAEFELLEDCKGSLQHVERLFIEIHTFAGQLQKVADLLKAVEAAGFRYFLENANYQNEPLSGSWIKSTTGMDMQLNLYAIRNDESTST